LLGFIAIDEDLTVFRLGFFLLVLNCHQVCENIIFYFATWEESDLTDSFHLSHQPQINCTHQLFSQRPPFSTFTNLIQYKTAIKGVLGFWGFGVLGVF
jgi:hypothetical protein